MGVQGVSEASAPALAWKAGEEKTGCLTADWAWRACGAVAARRARSSGGVQMGVRPGARVQQRIFC